jgi:hypothetical protein
LCTALEINVRDQRLWAKYEPVMKLGYINVLKLLGYEEDIVGQAEKVLDIGVWPGLAGN